MAKTLRRKTKSKSPQTRSAAVREFLGKRARALYWLCFLGMLLPIGARVFATVPYLGWLLDLGTHWQFAYLPVALIAALAGWRGEARGAALMGALFGLGMAIYFWSPLAPHSALDRLATPELTIASANLHLDNANGGAMLDWAVRQGADVVVLQEVGPEMAEYLKTRADYRYRFVHARSDPFGLAVLSRLPLRNPSLAVEEGATPRLRAELEIDDRVVTLQVVHAFPPISEEAHRARERLVETLDREAGTSELLVAAGDYNASPWSSVFRRVGNLRLASSGAPTWHEILPIDHVLIGPGWRVVEAYRGPPIGSDHRPVLVRLKLGEPSHPDQGV